MPTYPGVALECSLMYKYHIQKVSGKASAWAAALGYLASMAWAASFQVLRTTVLAMVYAQQNIIGCRQKCNWNILQEVF